MEIETAVQDGIAYLHLSGRLTAGAAEIQLVAAVDELLRRELRQLVVDMSAVPFVDSTGLGALVRCHGRCVGRQGSLRVEGAQGSFLNVLKLTRLERLLAPPEEVPDV